MVFYRRQAGSYRSTSFVARMKSGRNMLATPGFHPVYRLLLWEGL